MKSTTPLTSPPASTSFAPPAALPAQQPGPPSADVIKLLDEALKAFQEEYKDRVDTWRVIEGKAQTVLTASGAFLGGLFALAQKFERPFAMTNVWLVVISVIALIGAATCALLALRPRNVQEPPGGDMVWKETITITRGGHADPEQVQNMKGDFAGVWRQSVRSFAEANKYKAKLVRLSQLLIGVGALSVAALTISLLAFRLG